MAKRTYTAEVGGYSFSQTQTQPFATITDARKWAEEYGSQADWCTILDKNGIVVASHRRNGSTNRWHKGAI